MDLKHIIAQQRRRSYGPSFDIAFSTDKSNVSRVGPNPVHTRASSGTFVNENGIIVGKTRSTTSLNPVSVPVGGVAVFEVPSGSVVGWLNNSIVVVMEDTDGNDQIGAQRHVTGTLIHKTDTTITLLVTSKVGTTTLSSWVVSYRGLRIDHDPVTGLCRGVLLEGPRTNIIPRSETFDDTTVWTTARLVSQPIANTHIAPDNTLSAEKLIPTSTNDNHRIDRATVSGLFATTYTISAFVKADGYSGFGISLGSTPVSSPTSFDLQSGTITNTISGWTAQLQAFPNGWYRCSATFVWSSGSRLYFYVGQTGTSFTYSGDETSGIIIWGAQMEIGRHASSYIPTTAGVSAVRSEDIYSITGQPFLRFFNQTEGTLVCKATNLSGIADAGLLGTLSITAADRSLCAINLYRNVDFTLRSDVVQGPSFATAATFNFTTTAGAEGNTVIAFKENDFASSNNGSSVQTDTSGVFPSSPLNQMLIGTNGGQRMFGWISNIKHFPKRLVNSSVQTLSAIVTDTITYNGVAITYNGAELLETS